MYLAGFRPSRFSLMFHFQNHLHRHTLSEKNGTMEHYFIINNLRVKKREHYKSFWNITQSTTIYHQNTPKHISPNYLTQTDTYATMYV